MKNKYMMMMILIGFTALIPIGVFFADSNVSKEKIKQLLTAWNASLQTDDLDKVVANYANDAILLPTMSSKIRHNHEEIKDYFKHFLKLKAVEHVDEENIRVYGDIAVNSGRYTFNILKNGKSEQIKARFTFVYRRAGGKWLIIEHHSSVLPETE